MSLMSLLAKPNLSPEERRQKAEKDIADLQREMQGIHADFRAIEQDPVKFCRDRFGSSMERLDELCPREKARLADIVDAGRKREQIIARRIELLRERL